MTDEHLDIQAVCAEMGHRPGIVQMADEDRKKAHYIMCELCGILLDGRTLEKLDIKTDDWERARTFAERIRSE